MTEDQFKSISPLYHSLVEVEKFSENLKTKLPFAINQIKKNIPSDQTQKKLLSAAKSLLSKVASTFKTVSGGLSVPDKDVRAMTMAEFKEKFGKVMKSSRSASDWGVKFFAAYQNLLKTGWSPSSNELMVLACFTYAKTLINDVSAAQIEFASLK